MKGPRVQLLLLHTLGAVTRDTFTVVNDPFTCGNLAWCVWPDFPEINLPWEISMVTSKRRKKPAMTFNVLSSKQRFLDSQGKRANQVSSFDNMKPPKNILFFIFFFLAWLREIRDWLNWFVGLDLGTIFPPQRIVLFLACNRTMGCRWTERRNRRSRLKKKSYIPSLNYRD